MRRLHGLDALRGIAAILVFVHHLRETYHLAYIPFAPDLAVDLFFLLSGFVMARTYDERLGESITPSRFIALRYERLWFPLAFGALVGFIVAQTVEGPSLGLAAALAAQLLFLPAPWHGWFALNLPAWSIFVEIISNAIHALLRRTWLLTICWAFSALLFITTTAVAGRMLWGNDLPSTAGSIPRGLASYFLGVLLFRRFGDRPLGCHPIAAIVAFPVALVLGANLLPHSVLGPLAVFALFPLILRSAMGLEESRLAQAAGALSFPLYAVHLPIIWVAHLAGMSLVAAGGAAICVALGITLLFEVQRRAKSSVSAAQTA